MQPGVAGRFGAVWQQLVDAVLTATTAEATARWGADWIVIQPFDDAAFKGSCLGLRARQSTVELGNTRPLVKVNLPILARPSVAAGPEQRYDLGLMSGNCVENRGWRRRGCAQRKIVAIECEFYTGGAGGPESLGRAQSRVPQPVTVFSADRAEGGKGGKGGAWTATTRHAVRPSASAF